MEFLRSFLRRHFAGKPVVSSRNVACFLKIDFMITLNEKPLLIESLFALVVGGVWTRVYTYGMVFEETAGVYERIYSSYQFRMNKKEREMCQFEVDFKKSFLLAF